MIAYVDELIRLRRAPETVRRASQALDLFKHALGPARVKRFAVEDLSRDVMREVSAWLSTTDSLHGRPRKASTIAKDMQILQGGFWQWLFDNDDTGTVPYPRLLELPAAQYTRPEPPTWAEMDACIRAFAGGVDERGRTYAAHEGMRRLAFFLRFTGLRVDQATKVRWEHVQLEAGYLRVVAGKSAEEKRGRVVPLSKHLVAEMATWGLREGYVFAEAPVYKVARTAMNRAWVRSGVRERAWKGAPFHCFRDGFLSGLKEAGADVEASKFLVGHSLGLRDRYVGEASLPLKATIALVPAFTATNVLALRAKGEA